MPPPEQAGVYVRYQAVVVRPSFYPIRDALRPRHLSIDRNLHSSDQLSHTSLRSLVVSFFRAWGVDSLRAIALRASFSALIVLVVPAPPYPRLVASLGGAVEPLVHAPEAVQSARIGGIGVVDNAVLDHERAHARSLARIRGHVGSGHDRILGDR